MKKYFILVWVTIFFLSGFQIAESVKPPVQTPAAPEINKETNKKKTEKKPVSVREMPEELLGEKIKKPATKTVIEIEIENLLILKGKIEEIAEIKETGEKQVTIVTKEEKPVLITVSSETEFVLEDGSKTTISSLDSADLIEAFCNKKPEKDRYRARIIKIIE